MQTADKTETSQYLTFTLGDEFFAIEVAHVREVPEVNTVSRIPGMPDFMRGGHPGDGPAGEIRIN